MTSNKLKIIACISMVCDHVGYLLFPDVVFLRYIGRLALPIFAFFIAEGCLYTRSKVKYFLQMISLAVFCQLFYIGESIINGSITEVYLNILFTFSLSIVVCSAYIFLADAIKAHNKNSIMFGAFLFSMSICLAIICCTMLSAIVGIPVTVDYGIEGILLPLSALIFSDRTKRFVCFGIGTLIFCFVGYCTLPYIWFSLFALPLILFYNGKRGTKKLKWAFYFFYPLHFAVIYGIDLLM